MSERTDIADEIEHWATVNGRPDVLSMAEAVAEHWQEIVAALRGQAPVYSAPTTAKENAPQ